MLLPQEQYDVAGLSSDLNLATIADFNSLISMSQEHLTPIYALTSRQMGAVGVVLEGYERSRDAFHEQFQALASTVHDMIESAEADRPSAAT